MAAAARYNPRVIMLHLLRSRVAPNLEGGPSVPRETCLLQRNGRAAKRDDQLSLFDAAAPRGDCAFPAPRTDSEFAF
jgi:hypothetical protein